MVRRTKDPSPYLDRVTPVEREVINQDFNLFYRPKEKPENKGLNQLIASLSNIVPSLSNYSVTEEVKLKASEEAKAVENHEINKERFAGLVKNGEIPEGANPFYYNKMMELDLDNKARLFKRKFDEHYAKNNLDKTLNLEAFEEAYEEQLKGFYASQKLDKYDPLALNKSFFNITTAFRNERSQQHRNALMANIKGQTEQMFIMSTAGTIIDGQNADKTALEVLKETKILTDGLIATGSDKFRTNNLFLSGFKKYFDSINDEKGFTFAGELLDELDTFVLGTGHFGKSVQGSAYVEELRFALAVKEQKYIDRDNKLVKTRRVKRQETIYEEYLNEMDSNEEFDSFEFINQRTKTATDSDDDIGYIYDSEDRIYLTGLENTIKKTEKITDDTIDAVVLLQNTLSENPLAVRDLATQLANEGKITLNTYKAFYKAAGTYNVVNNNPLISQTNYKEYLPLFKDKLLTATGMVNAELPLMQVKYQDRTWNKYLELKQTLKGEELRKQMDIEIKGILADILQSSVIVTSAPEIFVPIFANYGIAITPKVTD